MGQVTISTEEYDNFKDLERLLKENKAIAIYFSQGVNKYYNVDIESINKELERANRELKLKVEQGTTMDLNIIKERNKFEKELNKIKCTWYYKLFAKKVNK